MRVQHTLEPIYNEDSRVLILGSMPSATSRSLGKYYGHKYNRFWAIMEELYKEDATDWRSFILKHKIALWDVIESCDITGSSDSSIKNVIPNDIPSLLEKTKIEKIFVLGKSAYNLYNKYLLPVTHIECVYLPSSSSANATFSFEDLVQEYSIIKKYTQ